VSFCVKQSVFCFTLVCCVLCELCESLRAGLRTLISLTLGVGLMTLISLNPEGLAEDPHQFEPGGLN
jgi:hypothetical protein